jgi:hypothetical protein
MLFGRRNDLIIGLSFWVAPSVSEDPAALKKQLDRTTQSVDSLRKELAVAQENLSRWRSYAFLYEEPYSKLGPTRVRQILDDAIKKGGGNDKPHCFEGGNILLDVRMDNGQLTATISPEASTEALQALSVSGVFVSRGQHLSTKDLDAIWQALDRFYDSADCRFQYRLSYRTNDDYVAVRDEGPIERYCYMKSRKRLP